MQPTVIVTSRDGTQLAVYDTGVAGTGPTVLAVHGYPDNASVWDEVCQALVARNLRVIRYDVRGTGQSGKPSGRAAYRLERLAEDALAVLDGLGIDHPVHLLAHDWGSVQGWYFVTVDELAGRLASFTSISGPSIGHIRPWLTDSVRTGSWRSAASQLIHLSYIGFFQLPVLPELAWRSGIIDRMLDGAAASHRSLADKVNGLQLYRANLLTLRGYPNRQVPLPVQVIAPDRDRYVGTRLQLEGPRPFVPSLRTSVVAAGHWVMLEQPELIAERVAEFVATVEETSL
jgi:pimeloyl-ACP methyl ester carboxylesterase